MIFAESARDLVCGAALAHMSAVSQWDGAVTAPKESAYGVKLGEQSL